MSGRRFFILVIGDDGACLVPPRGHPLLAPLFATSHADSHAAPLFQSMAARPDTPVLILADILAQEFRRETLPRLGFFDRRKLLTRRLRQHFPAPPSPQQPPLSTALLQKNGMALFACLHGGGLTGAWQKKIDVLSNPLLGVALAPLEGAEILARLLPESRKGWAMLLSWQRTGGFRQIVTHDGSFVFTRLTPPPRTTEPDAFASALADDLRATQGYLARYGLHEGTALRVVSILPESLHTIPETLPAPFKTALTLTPHQAAKRLGLNPALGRDDPASDLLYAGWIAHKKRPAVLLLPEDKREAARARTTRRWGWRTAAALWLVTLLYLGFQGHALFWLASDHRLLLQNVAALHNRLVDERATLAPITAPLRLLRAAVARQRLFAGSVSTPQAVLAGINTALGEAARVTKLDWRDLSEGTNSDSLQITLRLTDNASAPASSEAARREIVQHFDQLAEALRATLPAYRVMVSRYPFLIRPDDTLSNANAGQEEAPPPTADLILRREKP